ncbi:MAG: hypothetical protein CMH54_01650 [Myxococcales bacterium]|nr:hypothetical protein [Myxococcales bacterium]
MNNEEIWQLVRNVPALAGLSDVECREFVGQGRVIEADKGNVILNEGRTGLGIFLVLNGMLTVRRQIMGQFPVFANLYQNDIFGEIGLLTGRPAGATIVAATECTLLLLPTAVVQRNLSNGDSATFKLMRHVVTTIQKRTLVMIDRMGDVYGHPKKHLPLFERMYTGARKG